MVEGTRLEPVARAVWHRLPIGRPAVERDRDYDRQLEDVMRRVLDPSSSCIDAGAHTGKVLRSIVALAPEGHHLAFEPLPACATTLRAEFPTVDVRQQALGDSTGVAPFRAVPGEHAGYSGFARRPWDRYPEEGVEVIEVDVARLDDVVDPNRSFRFIKVDVEGGELDLFRGGQELLNRCHPYIGFENSSDAREVHRVLVEEVGLQLSLMHRWLAGESPLTREQFLHEAGGNHYFFLAHPRV
jgi:FkbM family methyltransferase